MTTGAADTVRKVFGLGKILRLQAGLMAFGADRRGLGWAQFLEADDLRDIAATINMGLCRTMTSLAPVLVTFEQRGMGSVGKVLVPYILVARLANVDGGVLVRRAARGCQRARRLRTRLRCLGVGQ